MTNTDDDTTCVELVPGVETEEIDVPPGGGTRKLKEAIFSWLLRTRNLWMISGEYADKMEGLLGVSLLFKLAHLKTRWESSYSLGHPALQRPRAARARESAFGELERFLKTLPSDRM